MIISKKLSLYRSLFAYFTAGLLVTACDSNSDFNINAKKTPQTTHRVEVITVEKKPVSLVQTVSGTLQATTKIRLYNEESGRIIELPYHEGDSVEKGTLLVQLDNELLKTDVAKATASREQAEVDLSRLRKLLPKQISTQEEVANARTVLDLAIAEEKRQLTRLDRTSIKAPIDGLITKRLYEPGDLLAAQSHIHSIIDPSALLLEASLAERWIPLVSVDQEITLRIDALGDKPFKARIVRIHPTINASTHKGLIEIKLDPVPDGAKVGQFARASIDLKATDRLVIPVHSIQYEPEGAYVFRIVDTGDGGSVAEKVHIEQGQQFGTVTEVLSALRDGDRIVSRGYLGLRDGKKVTVSNTEDSITQTIQQDYVGQQ
jgi:membrane fusion protein (multidrug efflux system)